MSDRDVIAETIGKYVVKLMGVHWTVPEDQAYVLRTTYDRNW